MCTFKASGTDKAFLYLNTFFTINWNTVLFFIKEKGSGPFTILVRKPWLPQVISSDGPFDVLISSCTCKFRRKMQTVKGKQIQTLSYLTCKRLQTLFRNNKICKAEVPSHSSIFFLVNKVNWFMVRIIRLQSTVISQTVHWQITIYMI